jgi:conjugative transfer region protein (TIGR03750 family)
MLNNITHKMPIYKDCTLMEVMITAISSFLVLACLFSLIAKILFGFFWPGYLLGSSIFYFVTKLLLSKLQKLKYGKPHAYYQHLIIKKLSNLGLMRSSYLSRKGKWSVRRKFL